MSRGLVKQVPTRRVTIAWIMSSPEFKRGLDDARKGIAFDWRVSGSGCDGADGADGAWNYERGRLFAFIAPLDMPLRTGGRINPGAVALYNAARGRNLIL
jgi:hypothetical protein